MQSEAKKLYDALNEDGVLKQQYGKKMTGDWEKDKKSFMTQYEANEKLFGLDAIDLDDLDADDYVGDDY
tara:strand:+ start:155 stop:361 length:207 start_codon:yes stop_codon:yes gene_type:complete